jgi:hypothetical protein
MSFIYALIVVVGLVVGLVSGLISIVAFFTTHPRTKNHSKSFLGIVFAGVLLVAGLLAFFSSNNNSQPSQLRLISSPISSNSTPTLLASTSTTNQTPTATATLSPTLTTKPSPWDSWDKLDGWSQNGDIMSFSGSGQQFLLSPYDLSQYPSGYDFSVDVQITTIISCTGVAVALFARANEDFSNRTWVLEDCGGNRQITLEDKSGFYVKMAYGRIPWAPDTNLHHLELIVFPNGKTQATWDGTSAGSGKSDFPFAGKIGLYATMQASFTNPNIAPIS